MRKVYDVTRVLMSKASTISDKDTGGLYELGMNIDIYTIRQLELNHEAVRQSRYRLDEIIAISEKPEIKFSQDSEVQDFFWHTLKNAYIDHLKVVTESYTAYRQIFDASLQEATTILGQ